MARRHLGTNTRTHAEARLDAYLADLAARLRGPRRRRGQILAELRDGLDHATEHHTAAGLTPDRAATAAIAQFGTPQAVAEAFSGELATAYARRTIAVYVATGPLVGVWWLLLLQPQPWRTGPIALIVAIPVLPLVALAIVTAGATFATTGRLMRWLPETSPHRALAATISVATLCVVADLTMITVLLASGTPIRPPLGVMAVAASLTRIAASVVAIRRATRYRQDRDARR